MARRFNGSSDFITFAVSSAVQSLVAGPLTLVAVVKINDTNDGALVHARTSGGTNSWWMEIVTGGVWNYGQAGVAKQIGTVTTSDGWEVLIGQKIAGGVNAPRGRRIVLGGGTTDVTAGSGLSDGTAPGAGGILQVGKWGTAAEYLGADVAAVAVFDSDLSDATTATFTTYAAILAATPAWVVAFDQASASDPIDDDSTNGTGDSVTITGTTIVADPSGFFAAGPTNYTKSVAGGITPAAVLVRQAGKRPAGTLTPAGAVVRQSTKAFAGAFTPAGTLAAVKAALRSFTGSLTPTGSMARRTGKALGGAVAPAGAVRRSTTKLLAGALAGVGGVLKQTAKRFVSAIAPSGAVSTGQPTVEAKATSSATVAARQSSTALVTTDRSSTSAVTARATSSGGVT